MTPFQCAGWVELDGRKLSATEIEEIVRTAPDTMRRFGGEFRISYGKCHARDHFGIMPGPCEKGAWTCDGKKEFSIEPDPEPLALDAAIDIAIKLRSDEGVVALSGGVDSSLVAALAGRECVAVGLADSHDLRQAQHAAALLGRSCTSVTITPNEIEAAVPTVLGAIPKKDPVNLGIALTQFFIARWAGQHGYQRIITGQGADELFGGYSRTARRQRLKKTLHGMSGDWNSRQNGTSRLPHCTAVTSPCRTLISGSCARRKRSRPKRKCMMATGRSRYERLQRSIFQKNSRNTRKKRCSTGAGSGEY